MYNNPYIIPGYFNQSMTPNLIRGIPTSTMLSPTTKTGLLSKLGTSLSGIKKINWGGLINNTSKTLGIINQTIPIVRQVGPIMNNMRSMMRVASIFKDETDIPKKKPTQNLTTNNYSNNYQNNNIHSTQPKEKHIYSKQQEYDESPTFFINT